MRLIKCIKITYYALGQEHIKYAPCNVKMSEIQETVKQVWDTAHVGNVQMVQVDKSEYNANQFETLKAWINDLKTLDND